MWSHDVLNLSTEISEPGWMDLGKPEKEKNEEKMKEKAEMQLE